MGSLFHFRRSSPRLSPPDSLAAIEKNLLACVNAIKKYLDSFLSLDVNGYKSLPFEEWSRLIISFFILYKLSAGSKDISNWNTNLCRNIIDLEAYLTNVARRVRSTRSSLDFAQAQRDELYYVLPLVLETARDSFVLVRDAPALVGPGHKVHVDLSRSRRAAGASAAKCPATGFWIDKAVAADHGSDWQGVAVAQYVDPAEQLSKTTGSWEELLHAENHAG